MWAAGAPCLEWKFQQPSKDKGPAMNESNAAFKADELIKLLLTYQADPLGKYPLADEVEARKAAQVLAAFRQELTAQLMQQP